MKTILNQIRHSKQEIDKVIFPNRPQIKDAFLSVFVMVSTVSIFILGVDFIITKILGRLL